MQWDDKTREAIEVGLNEAEMLGLRLDHLADRCELLLHVMALPAAGPIDPDPRRILRLLSPTQIRVVLRRGECGPAVPLADLDAVERFFTSLSWSGSMYGWRFLDDPSLASDWPAEPSLIIDIRPGAGSHSLFWFNECGREESEGRVAYCIEGTITFDDLEVVRADGAARSLSDFVDEGRRCWEALHGRDERLSVEAQQAAHARGLSWRTYAQNAITVSGSADPPRPGIRHWARSYWRS